MKPIRRDSLPADYAEMMETEDHHAHEIIEDKNGTLRWKEDPFVSRFIDACNLNDITRGFYSNGTDKNCEAWRELYRKMGYSLSGYWEIFYWEANNEDAPEYVPNAK